MSKQVYISADYSEGSGDRDVVAEFNKWGKGCEFVFLCLLLHSV